MGYASSLLPELQLGTQQGTRDRRGRGLRGAEYPRQQGQQVLRNQTSKCSPPYSLRAHCPSVLGC